MTQFGDTWAGYPRMWRANLRCASQPHPGADVALFEAPQRVAVLHTPTGPFLPGGGAVRGETPEETLRREAREAHGDAITPLSAPMADVLRGVVSSARRGGVGITRSGEKVTAVLRNAPRRLLQASDREWLLSPWMQEKNAVKISIPSAAPDLLSPSRRGARPGGAGKAGGLSSPAPWDVPSRGGPQARSPLVTEWLGTRRVGHP
jgi:hypothetical protein